MLKLLLMVTSLFALTSPPPEDDHRTVIEPLVEPPATWSLTPEELGEAGAEVRDVMDRLPGLTARSLGDSFSLTTLEVRGASPEHTHVTLDGVSLHRADGSPVDLSLLPMWLIGSLQVWPAHAPLGMGGGLGGAVALKSIRARENQAETLVEVGA